ncbi:MAG: hypothetical protein ACPG4T_05170 [Nannocystaceae bacterium]
MRTVTANFNRRTTDQRIVLGVGVRSIAGAPIAAGQRIRLTDRAMEVEADVVEAAGILVAVARWETLDFVDGS